jgi:hypothetical protein
VDLIILWRSNSLQSNPRSLIGTSRKFNLRAPPVPGKLDGGYNLLAVGYRQGADTKGVFAAT